MLRTFEGIYRDGKIELAQQPADLAEARVIVTFLSPSNDDEGPDLSPKELQELRWKLASFEEDWNAPGMEVYDHY